MNKSSVPMRRILFVLFVHALWCAGLLLALFNCFSNILQAGEQLDGFIFLASLVISILHLWIVSWHLRFPSVALPARLLPACLLLTALSFLTAGITCGAIVMKSFNQAPAGFKVENLIGFLFSLFAVLLGSSVLLLVKMIWPHVRKMFGHDLSEQTHSDTMTDQLRDKNNKATRSGDADK